MIRMLRALTLSLGLIGLTSCQSNVRKECPNPLKNWRVGGNMPELFVFNMVEVSKINKISWNKVQVNLETLALYLIKYRKFWDSNRTTGLILRYEGYVDCRLLNEVRREIDRKANCGKAFCIENPDDFGNY